MDSILAAIKQHWGYDALRPLQYEAMTAQSKDLAALAQKVCTETVEPIKSGMTTAMKKVA